MCLHNWPAEINAIWQEEGDHWELPEVVPWRDRWRGSLAK